MRICKSFFIKVITSQYLPVLGIFLFAIFYFANNVFAYTIPQITNINFSPNLNISRFADYNINVLTSGTFISGSIDLTRINGDGGSCKQYYASGTCFSSGISTYPLTYIGNNIRQETGVRPDDLYPQIFFAPNEMVWNNTHLSNTISLNNYEILHLQNPFTMESGMSFFIELNVAPVSTGNSLDLNVYLVQKNKTISFFQNNWLNNTGAELITSFSRTATSNHTHTVNSSHYLVTLIANADGTIGTKHLNLNNDFRIVLSSNTTPSRGRYLNYLPSLLCENTNGRYLGNPTGRSTVSQSGCPDAHVHVARTFTRLDGTNILSTMTYQISGVNYQTLSSGNFYFSNLPNMAPNSTSFLTPSGLYTGDINISWNPSTDPNNDALTYNLYLLNSTGDIIQTLITGTSDTGYVVNKGTISNGTYGLKGEVCDTSNLCTAFYLNDNFVIYKFPTRNNSNFINDSFWRRGPTSNEIKEAIFGNASNNRTSYTQGRTSNPCSTGTISILNIQNYAVSGMNSLPHSLTGNTIYVLNSGSYITTGQINYLGNCIAVIGKGTVKFYSSVVLNSGTDTSIFKSYNRQNIILSNLSTDGLGDGLGNYRSDGSFASGNSYGVYFYTTKNSSINKITSFNNKQGIELDMNENTVITNNIIYNNGIYGIYIYASTIPNYVINTQIFDNNNVGLATKNCTGQIFNNLQVYNNKGRGINRDNSKNSSISNSMSYNNYTNGIYLQNNSSNNIINNSWFYNNGSTGIYIFSGMGNKYYGTIKLFNNASSVSANTLVGGISVGSSGDTLVAGLGRNDGMVDTGGTIGYQYITNPRTNDGRDLISGSNRLSTNRSNKTWTGIEFVSYTYGTGLLKQARSVSYGTSSYFVSNLYYDSNKYIAQIDFSNTNPDWFSFINITGASLNQIYTSNIITLTGMDVGTFNYVTLTGRGSIIKNGTNIGQSGTGSNGDQFSIQITSSSNYYYLRSGSLAIGTTIADFTVTTMEQITTYIPNQFSFSPIIGATVNTLYTSNIVSLTGMSPGVATGVSVNTGYLLKNGINIGQSGTGGNSDQFILALTSSNAYSTLVSSTMSIAGVTGAFSISTQTANYIPNQFSFSPIIGATVNTLYTSNIVSLTGMSPGVSTGVSVNAGYLLKNGINIGQSGTGGNSDQFILALTSSNAYSTLVSSTMSIAGVTGAFFISTQTANYIPHGPAGGGSHGSSTGNLRLEITTSSGSCTYGTSLYIGSHHSQFAAYDMTGTNFSSSFSCVDTEGLSGWTMTMEATTDLSNGAQTISKDNVSLIASPNYVSAGACTTGTNQDSWVSIGSTPGTILWKSSGQGDICTITSDTVNLAVHIPASQAVGLYTGTLSLNMPF